MGGLVRRVVSIARTDLRIELMDRSTWLFYLALPLLFTVITGSATGGSSSGFSLAVIDRDGSTVAAALVTALRDQRGLEVRLVGTASTDQPGSADRALTIPAGFGGQLLAGGQPQLELANASADAIGIAVRQSVAAATDRVTSAAAGARLATEQADRIHPFESPTARDAFLADALAMAQTMAADPPVVSTLTTSPEAVTLANGFTQSSPGELVTWTLITLLGVSDVFVSERAGGTLRRLLITPSRRSTIVTGKIVGRYALGLLQMAILIVVGGLAFGVAWGRSPIALILVVLAFGFCAVTLGVLLGTIARTRQQAIQLTVLSSMVLASLGGAWFPLELAPDAFRTAASVLPTTWAMSGFNTVILQGGGPLAVLPAVAVLTGFGAAFLTLANSRLRIA